MRTSAKRSACWPTLSCFRVSKSQPPNGKVDLRALPLPSQVIRPVEDTFSMPLLTVHHQLIRIWEDLLEVRPIGIRDNFFELGGHSLLAARLVDTIERVFGKKLPLATL